MPSNEDRLYHLQQPPFTPGREFGTKLLVSAQENYTLFFQEPSPFPSMAFATINTSALFIPAIEEAFAAEPALKQRVYDATGK